MNSAFRRSECSGILAEATTPPRDPAVRAGRIDTAARTSRPRAARIRIRPELARSRKRGSRVHFRAPATWELRAFSCRASGELRPLSKLVPTSYTYRCRPPRGGVDRNRVLKCECPCLRQRPAVTSYLPPREWSGGLTGHELGRHRLGFKRALPHDDVVHQLRVSRRHLTFDVRCPHWATPATPPPTKEVWKR